MAKPVILVGVTGSIAAVKAPLLVRQLLDQGYTVHCVMTVAAKKFVSELALSTFINEPVISDMFGPEGYKMPHLTYSKEAQLMLVAPASAAILARMAHGEAEDIVSLSYLSTTAPTLVAPAMHDTMWEHPATQENVRILKSRGVQFVGPQMGALADKSAGEGRMSEVEDILKAVEGILKTS